MVKFGFNSLFIKILLSIHLAFVMNFSVTGQNNNFIDFSNGKVRWFNGFSGGTSTLQGYTFALEGGAIWKKNDFQLVFNYQSEIGNNAGGFILPTVFYNDKIKELAIEYGRHFQANRLLFHLNIGPSIVWYKNKSLGHSSGYLSLNYASSKSYVSAGLSVQTKIEFFISQRVAFNLKIHGNVNPNINSAGAQAGITVIMI